MTVEMTHEMLLDMIKGTGGPNGYGIMHKFEHVGKLTGFPNEHWYWDNAFLEKMSSESLLALYNDLKTLK